MGGVSEFRTLGFAIALAGCSQSSNGPIPTEQIASSDTSASSTTVAGAPMASDPKLEKGSVLMGEGITGAEVGRPWHEVSKAFDSKGTYGEEGVEGCEVYEHRGGKFAAMVVDGKIARIEVTEPGVSTAEGITIGSTLNDLERVYGARLTAEKNVYDGEDIQFVWQGTDRGLVFYLDNAKVIFMAGGGAAIRYVEGCL